MATPKYPIFIIVFTIKSWHSPLTKMMLEMSSPIIVTSEAQTIEWFIQLAQATILTEEGDHPTFFHYQNGQMHLHTHQQRIHLSLSNLLPKDIKKHVLYKLIRQYDQPGSCIVDCTGGLGRDSLIALFASNNHIITYERNPILALALKWLQHKCTSLNWDIHHDDAKRSHHHGGIWLIDPMFPKHPKMAKSQNRMQIIQHLVPYSQDDQELIEHATTYAGTLLLKKPPWQSPHTHSGLWSVSS